MDLECATTDELAGAVERLRAEERGVSQVRAAVQEVVDQLSTELTGRYARGELSPDSALRLPN